jgi:gentisate 1,2-dioxygenase
MTDINMSHRSPDHQTQITHIRYRYIMFPFHELFHDVISIRTIERRMVGRLVISELERIWKEAVVRTIIEGLTHCLPGVTEENYEKSQSGLLMIR